MSIAALAGLVALAAGDRIDEIKWLASKEAFAKAKESGRWVLIYKEWPK